MFFPVSHKTTPSPASVLKLYEPLAPATADTMEPDVLNAAICTFPVLLAVIFPSDVVTAPHANAFDPALIAPPDVIGPEVVIDPFPLVAPA